MTNLNHPTRKTLWQTITAILKNHAQRTQNHAQRTQNHAQRTQNQHLKLHQKPLAHPKAPPKQTARNHTRAPGTLEQQWRHQNNQEQRKRQTQLRNTLREDVEQAAILLDTWIKTEKLPLDVNHMTVFEDLFCKKHPVLELDGLRLVVMFTLDHTKDTRSVQLFLLHQRHEKNKPRRVLIGPLQGFTIEHAGNRSVQHHLKNHSGNDSFIRHVNRLNPVDLPGGLRDEPKPKKPRKSNC